MSNSKDSDKDSKALEERLVKAFIGRHGREPDWGERWVLAGNRRTGAHYKRHMKKNNLPVYLDEWTDLEWNRMSPLEQSKSKAAKQSYERKLKKAKDKKKSDAAAAKKAIKGVATTQTTKKEKLMPRALHLLSLEYTYASIAEDIGVNEATLSKWFSSVGIRRGKINTKSGEGVHEVSEKGGEYQKVLDTAMDKGNVTPEEQHKIDRTDLDKKTLSHQKRIAKEDEIAAMPAMFRPTSGDGGEAEGATNASRYSGFMANALGGKMKEALTNLPAPQSYKDLKILDDMMSKHLGVGKSGESAAGRLTIDVSILNAKNRPRGEVIAAEIVEKNGEVVEEMVKVAHEIEADVLSDDPAIDDFEDLEVVE